MGLWGFCSRFLLKSEKCAIKIMQVINAYCFPMWASGAIGRRCSVQLGTSDVSLEASFPLRSSELVSAPQEGGLSTRHTSPEVTVLELYQDGRSPEEGATLTRVCWSFCLLPIPSPAILLSLPSPADASPRQPCWVRRAHTQAGCADPPLPAPSPRSWPRPGGHSPHCPWLREHSNPSL